MNVAALIFALAGSAISIFQPVLPFLFQKLSVFDVITSGINDPSITNMCAVVLGVALIGAVSGACAFFRNGISVLGLGGCAAFYGFIIANMLSETNAQPGLGIIVNAIGFSWQNTLLLWGGCYLIAAVLAWADTFGEAFRSKWKSAE